MRAIDLKAVRLEVARALALCWCCAACATPVDLYLGSDVPPAVATREPDAGESRPPQTPPPVADSTPDATRPDMAEPDADTPDAGPPDAATPDTAEPDADTPDTPAPDAGRPTSLPTACAAFVADCDGDAANGCEVDLRSDRAHCGTCEVACRTEDCVCRDGKRALQCKPGRADCDADVSNGCEVDLQSDLANCGACARLCHTMGHDAMAAMCNAGVCELTCRYHAYPQIDCDHDPDNGCETQAWTDTQNCGMCGRRCLNCELGTCMI